MPDLLDWIVQLAKWKCDEATRAVQGYDAAKLPLSPEWQYFVKLCNDEKVSKEGLDLAVLLSYGPRTFNPAEEK